MSGRGRKGRPGGRRGGPRPQRGGSSGSSGSRGGRGRRDRGAERQPPPRHEPDAYRPPPVPPRPEELVPTDRTFRDLRLFRFQVEALEAIERGDSVLVAAPTGAGKTLVADYAIEEAFEEGWRVVYTAPIKALSNQKYRDFRADHGDQVGILTGDVTINPDADLLVMTTEVFRNTLFETPHRFDDFRFVIHDEIHYIDDPDRGTVWEESIIHAPPQMRIVGLSATIPNVREFADWVRTLRDEPVTVVEMVQRPVPLDHRTWVPDFGALPVKDGLAVLRQPPGKRRTMRREREPTRVLDWLEREKLLPALVFCFSRKDCELHALANRGRRLLDDAKRHEVLVLFDDLVVRYECKRTKAVDRLRELASAGVAYHHAGMLPVHKEIVERLFNSGLVRVLFATETFALGVNMPARTAVFLALRKFDGEKIDFMLCRSYGQMAGRAGRQGIDDHGLVVSMLDPQRDRAQGVERVIKGKVEPVRSRWNPDYSTLLALYRHMGDDVIATYQKSFARFQRDRQVQSDRQSPEETLLARRLALLKNSGYIEDGEVTEGGLFVSRVQGYEIQAGEWRDAGLLDRVDSRRMAMLLLGAVYEPRPKDTWSDPVDRKAGGIRREAFDRIERWRRKEWRAGIADMTQAPHFGLSAALELWIEGAPLTRLADVTSTTEGDIVRSFRLLLQFARQILKALPPEDQTTRRKLRDVLDMVDRDEVDARRQLEMGQDPVEESSEETDEDCADEDAEDVDDVDDDSAFGAGLDD